MSAATKTEEVPRTLRVLSSYADGPTVTVSREEKEALVRLGWLRPNCAAPAFHSDWDLTAAGHAALISALPVPDLTEPQWAALELVAKGAYLAPFAVAPATLTALRRLKLCRTDRGKEVLTDLGRAALEKRGER